MKDKSGLACFGWFVFGGVNMVISAIFGGYVLVKLWQWFVVPVFGFEQIRLVSAIGIGLLVSYLTHQHIPRHKDWKTSDELRQKIVESGWIVKDTAKRPIITKQS